MTNAHVVAVKRAAVTTERTPAGLRSAILAVSWILGWRNELSPVNGFVTQDTQCNPVIDIGYQFWVICKRFYVVSVYIPALLSAVLTSIHITLVDIFPPLSKIAFGVSTLAKKRFPAFPYRRSFSSFPFQKAITRTEDSTSINCIKRFTTSATNFIVRSSAFRPASSRTIFSSINAISLHSIRFTTPLTCFSNSSVLHAMYYNTKSVQHMLQFVWKDTLV
jgi:hypothetical protein